MKLSSDFNMNYFLILFMFFSLNSLCLYGFFHIGFEWFELRLLEPFLFFDNKFLKVEFLAFRTSFSLVAFLSILTCARFFGLKWYHRLYEDHDFKWFLVIEALISIFIGIILFWFLSSFKGFESIFTLSFFVSGLGGLFFAWCTRFVLLKFLVQFFWGQLCGFLNFYWFSFFGLIFCSESFLRQILYVIYAIYIF